MMKYTSVDSYNDDLRECLHQALTGDSHGSIRRHGST